MYVVPGMLIGEPAMENLEGRIVIIMVFKALQQRV